MSCFITPEGLELLRIGGGSPIWRAVVTLENCVTVNAACFAVLLLCVGFIAKKMGFWYETGAHLLTTKTETPLPRSRFAPFLAMVAFAVVPQFAEKVTRLQPFLLSVVPLSLSAAAVASLNTRLAAPEDANAEVEDDRRLVWVRLALAGALAAVGVWEGSYGICLTPGLLALTWFPFIRRGKTVSAVSAAWLVGFVAAFLLEPELVPNCSWSALHLRRVPLAGIGVFVFACVMPLAIVRRLGENRWTLGGWVLVLSVLATVTVTERTRFALQSSSERFVRHVLADVGDRKFLIGDGIFDILIDEYRPAGVKRIGTKTTAEREFLVNLLADNEPITNRVLVVDRYYGFGEMDRVSCEVCRDLTPSSADRRKMSEADRETVAQAQRVLFARGMMPLIESLQAMGKGFEDIPESMLKSEVDKARGSIRNGWRSGFCGLEMSATLLSLDVMCGDVRSLEADAITALVFNRDDPVANAALGSLRLRDGRLELAEKYLKRALKGGGLLAMGDYARLLVQQGRFAEAEEWVDKAMKKSPNDWQLRQPFAAVLIETGRFDEARRELNEIRRLAAAAGRVQAADPFLTSASRRLAERKGLTKTSESTEIREKAAIR